MRAEIFNSRHGIFEPSEKNHGLIANFSAQGFVSDFISTTGNVPFIFEKHIISLKAASPEIKPFRHFFILNGIECGWINTFETQSTNKPYFIARKKQAQYRFYLQQEIAS